MTGNVYVDGFIILMVILVLKEAVIGNKPWAVALVVLFFIIKALF